MKNKKQKEKLTYIKVVLNPERARKLDLFKVNQTLKNRNSAIEALIDLLDKNGLNE